MCKGRCRLVDVYSIYVYMYKYVCNLGTMYVCINMYRCIKIHKVYLF